MFELKLDSNVMCKLEPQADITVLELAYVVGLKGYAAMTQTQWDTLPPDVKRHFIKKKETP